MFRRRDWWVAVLFGVHLLHAFLFARLYPHAINDPDLLAYFVYFRSLVDGSTALHTLPYFTVPKPLLVFTLGALGNASWAAACSAVGSAALGALVYLIGRETLGRPAGVILSALLLLDVEKATLTLRSSADLWVALFLFAAVYLALRGRVGPAAVALLLSALVKPVTLPCAAYFLTIDGDRRRRWGAALLPCAAIPLILLANHLLLGSALGPGRFFAGFDALGEGTPIRPDEVLHFVVWRQLVKHDFVSTAPFGVFGLALWLGRDRRRLTSPYFLMPVLFLGGYLGLSLVAPYVPFFRFFWPVKVWFAGFIVFGMLEAARRVARGTPALRLAAAAVLLVFVADDYLMNQLSYRQRFAAPFQDAMAFVATTPDTLRRERHDGETILTPLAFMPYLMWELGVHDHPEVLVTAEQAAGTHARPSPDWVLYVPDIFASHEARDLVQGLIASGAYEVRRTNGAAALLARSAAGEPLAYAPPAGR